MDRAIACKIAVLVRATIPLIKLLNFLGTIIYYMCSRASIIFAFTLFGGDFM